MPQDLAIVLVDEVTRDVRAVGVQSGVGGLDLILSVRDSGVFSGIDETGLEKKIPQGIHVQIVAQVAVFVLSLMEKAQQLHVILGRDIDQRQPASHAAVLGRDVDHPAKDDLGGAGHFEDARKMQLHIRQHQPRAEAGRAFFLLDRKTRTGQIDHLQVQVFLGEGMTEDDVR